MGIPPDLGGSCGRKNMPCWRLHYPPTEYFGTIHCNTDYLRRRIGGGEDDRLPGAPKFVGSGWGPIWVMVGGG